MAEPDDDAPRLVEPLPVEVFDDADVDLTEPVAVEPIPVEPLPAAAFAPPPAYPPRRLGPPRVVTNLGVFSIVVASLGLIAAVVATFAVVIYASTLTAAATRAASIAAAAAPAVSAAPGPAEVVDPDGLAAADRVAVMQGLSRSRPVTPGQAVQLDELLAESGRRIVNVGGGIDPAVVAAAVTASGQLNALGMAGSEADSTPSYYVLSTGRLELTDGRAVFFPADGQPAVRAVAYVLPELAEGAAAPPLSDDAIRSTLRAVARLNGGRPKSAQVKGLLTLLRGSGQQVVVPTTDASDPAAEVTAASTDDDGTLTVSTARGGDTCQLQVTPGGQVSASLTTAAAAAAAAVPPLNSAALGFVVIAAAAQGAVAIYLLIAGIVTVRQSRFGRVLHWVYVGVKMPVATAAVIATASLFVTLRPNGVGPTLPWLVPDLLGLAYAVGVAAVLCGRTVRDYYRPV